MLELLSIATLLASLAEEDSSILERAEALAKAWEGWDGRPGTFRKPEGVGRFLGSGYTRTVYQIGDFAVKLPRDPEYNEFNTREAETWRTAPADLKRHLLPVLACDPDGRWLIMPLAERVLPYEAEPLCKYLNQEFGEVLSDCEEPSNVGRYQGRLLLWDYPDDISMIAEE